MTLADEILAAIPPYGCQLKEIWSAFQARPPQAVEAALLMLRTAAGVRILNGMISPTRHSARPKAEPEKPEVEVPRTPEYIRFLEQKRLLADERERLTIECQGIRADRGLNTAECLLSLRQASDASQERRAAIREMFHGERREAVG